MTKNDKKAKVGIAFRMLEEKKEVGAVDEKPSEDAEEKSVPTPYSTQMRVEKAEEEAMYAKRGDIALRSYYRHLKDISEVALKEHSLQFHNYLSLARRRQALDDIRNEKARKSLPSEGEMGMGKVVDERLASALKQAAKTLEYKLRAKDKEIERLQKGLEEKKPELKALERRIQRKARKVKVHDVINDTFRFPLFQKVARKLYEADQAISEFLLDVGSAEYVVTKENIISTTARRLMDARSIDEPDYFFDEGGNIISRWAFLARGHSDKDFSKLKKARKKIFNF